MEPKDLGVIVRKVVSVDGKTYYTVKGTKGEIFEIVVSSCGVVSRGQLIGGRGGEAQFSWIDTKQENGFIRSDGGNQSWHVYDQGTIFYKTIPSKPFNLFKKDTKLDDNIIS